jgi:hypothetical protein
MPGEIPLIKGAVAAAKLVAPEAEAAAELAVQRAAGAVIEKVAPDAVKRDLLDIVMGARQAKSAGQASSIVDNPYLDEFAARDNVKRFAWYSRLKNSPVPTMRPSDRTLSSLKISSFGDREELVPKYGFSVMDNEALTALKGELQQAPVLDLGTGNGYTPYLMRQLEKQLKDVGTSRVVAVEPHLPGEGSNQYFWQEGTVPRWTDIIKGDENLLPKYPQHTLMMSWAPDDFPMASNALNMYRGNRLIYIGDERYTGDAAFYGMLRDSWKLERTVSLPRWPGFFDDMKIYSR